MERPVRRAALLLVPSLCVLAIAAYVLLVPEDAQGHSCGGTAVAVLSSGAGAEATSRGLAHECHETATESTALGFSVAGLALVMFVVSVALRDAPTGSVERDRSGEART
jgi:hypothetical protein